MPNAAAEPNVQRADDGTLIFDRCAGIVERDELLGTVLADGLAEYGISVAVVPDEESLALPPDQPPLVVITGMNRSRNEDLAGLNLALCMRTKWPTLCIVYLAPLWPARLGRGFLAAGDRFSQSHLPRRQWSAPCGN